MHNSKSALLIIIGAGGFAESGLKLVYLVVTIV